MKTKNILPIFALGLTALFAACSGDEPAPNAPVVDPNAGNTDTNAPVVDPNAGTTDPNTPVVDPNAGATDPNTPVVDPNAGTTPETPTIQIDPNAPLDANGLPMTYVRPEPEGLATFPNNVSVEVEDYDAYNYFGAELTGNDHFVYGRFEARMQMVSIPGSVSSMFLYYDLSDRLEYEPWNEIDIEVLGKNPGAWQSNLITRKADDFDSEVSNKKVTSEKIHHFGDKANETFHLYAMIWTPEYISWEIDSVEVRRDYYGQKKGQVEAMVEEQSLRFNLWSAASVPWVGKFTGAELAEGPVSQLIDYVRVYSYDPATKGFTQLWQDDFEGTELSDHWRTGSWKMENTKLSPDNVVVEGGYCKLLMSREPKAQ